MGGMIRLTREGLLLGAILAQSAAAAAQSAPPVQRWADKMPAVASALGVTCAYCHRRRDAPPLPEGEKPKRVIAREMMKMVDELNARVQDVTGKSIAEVTRVECVTCHRGVTIPGQLSDILVRTFLKNGSDAAVAQYRDLRDQYYGRQSYDFGESELIRAGLRLGNRPDAGIELLKLNLEFYPKSVPSHITIAQLYIRKIDDESAIVWLEKALAIEPDNLFVRGQLEQLKHYRRLR